MTDYNELNASVTVHTPPRDSDGVEFSLDARGSEYPSVSNRDPRMSVYDAWVGGRIANGKVALRLGQMYLNDLGALGGLGGAALEAKAGRVRFGLFGGLEPKGFDVGYVPDVRKGGAYVAYDGDRGWRNVLGFVTVRNQGLAERNVLSTTNFIPVGREFFLYQAAEYDLTGPGGMGKGGLAYLFATARWAPVRAFEIQGLYQHGRSVDARTITLDQLAGRPVDAKSLDGYLFDSMGGRVTVEFARGWRVWGGYYKDKNNSDDIDSNRWQFGLSAINVLGSGFDVFASDNRTLRPGSSTYDAWYFSARQQPRLPPLRHDRLLDLPVRPPAHRLGRTHHREPALLAALQPVGDLEHVALVLDPRDGRAAGRRHDHPVPGPPRPDVPVLKRSL